MIAPEEFLEDTREQGLRELEEFLRIPSISSQPERADDVRRAAGHVLDGIARLDRVVAHVAPHRGVHARRAHLHDEAALTEHHVIDVRRPHGNRRGEVCAINSIGVESVEGCKYWYERRR